MSELGGARCLDEQCDVEARCMADNFIKRLEKHKQAEYRVKIWGIDYALTPEQFAAMQAVERTVECAFGTPGNPASRQVYAIDYDQTFSEDPLLWQSFCKAAIERGHAVWIVTCRMDTDENLEDLVAVTGLEPWRHQFTNMGPKKDYCAERGIFPSVWIDDMPESILRGR